MKKFLEYFSFIRLDQLSPKPQSVFASLYHLIPASSTIEGNQTSRIQQFIQISHLKIGDSSITPLVK